MRPLRNQLLLSRAKADSESRGGIIIPTTAQKKPHRGRVIAAGPGARDKYGNLIPMECKPGDVVLFADGLGVEVEHEGETLVLISEDYIIARASEADA